MNNEKFVVNNAALGRFIQILLGVPLTSAALCLARVVLEPIAFVRFGIALVWPFQQAAEARMMKPIALILAVLLALLVIFTLAFAVIWSIGDIYSLDLRQYRAFPVPVCANESIARRTWHFRHGGLRGLAMALAVTAIAMLKQSALFLVLAAAFLIGLGLTFWPWRQGNGQ